MSWKPSDIKWLDWEISSFCNAGCVDCNRWVWNPRTDEMNLNSYNKDINKFMTPAQFEHRIKQFEHLRFTLFQGNVGDPMTHPQIHELVEITFKHNPDIRLEINSNGSVGALKTWQKLCEHASKDILIVFSIDGLEDTNHIYRRGCDWNKIMRNAKMWIDAGGQAEWAMVDFPFNEHQRKEARQMAKDMGFKDFHIRERTSPDPEFDAWILEKQHEPVQQKLMPAEDFYPLDVQKDFDMQTLAKWNNRKIEPACTFLDAEGFNHWPNFHVNVEGTLWPCCFTSNLPYMQEYDRVIWQGMNAKYTEKYGPNWNNLDHHTLEEILATDWFSKDLQAGWEPDSKSELLVCKKNCCEKGYVWDQPMGEMVKQNKFGAPDESTDNWGKN